MQRACDLARKGLYTTTPNPRVGCVLVGNGRLLAEGYHYRAGLAHAEVAALAEAGDSARGATAYVTLEPCNHQGRTGACSEALIAAGVAEVVYGMQDPNPLVAGSGLARLADAGVRVRGPVLEEQVQALNPGFIKRMTCGLPWVRCKLAMSLDGRTAMASGESQWITGAEARAEVQAWRAQSCAIVTGVGTVLADDPALTVRDPRFGPAARQPLRVVVDSRGRTPPQARLLAEPGQTLIAVAGSNLAVPGAQCRPLPSEQGRVNLLALLQMLAAEACNEVMIEAGPVLAGEFLRQGLIDELLIYMAPKLMGNSARPLFGLNITGMADALPVTIDSITAVGADWRIVARPQRNS